MKCAYVVALLAMAAFVSKSTAMEAPKLPNTARKLKGSEIKALYEGSVLDFKNFTMDKLLTGATAYRGGKMKGYYDYGNGEEKGKFDGSYYVSEDTFCYKGKEKENCSAVYTDENVVYEVSVKGVVVSVSTKR